jgi:hypothetical protein
VGDGAPALRAGLEVLADGAGGRLVPHVDGGLLDGR